MRKFYLMSAIACSALLAGCAQNSQSANSAFCDQLSQEAFMEAVDQGKCDLDVTTAAGGPTNPGKSFHDHDEDHGGGDDGKGPDKDPDPDNDPDPGTGPSRSTEPSTDNF